MNMECKYAFITDKKISSFVLNLQFSFILFQYDNKKSFIANRQFYTRTHTHTHIDIFD